MRKYQSYLPYFFVQDMPSYPCTSCARRGRNESCMCGAWKDVFCTAYNSTRVGLQRIAKEKNRGITPQVLPRIG